MWISLNSKRNNRFLFLCITTKFRHGIRPSLIYTAAGVWNESGSLGPAFEYSIDLSWGTPSGVPVSAPESHLPLFLRVRLVTIADVKGKIGSSILDKYIGLIWFSGPNAGARLLPAVPKWTHPYFFSHMLVAACLLICPLRQKYLFLKV